jgi:hypothetical protein
MWEAIAHVVHVFTLSMFFFSVFQNSHLNILRSLERFEDVEILRARSASLLDRLPEFVEAVDLDAEMVRVEHGDIMWDVIGIAPPPKLSVIDFRIGKNPNAIVHCVWMFHRAEGRESYIEASYEFIGSAFADEVEDTRKHNLNRARVMKQSLADGVALPLAVGAL